MIARASPLLVVLLNQQSQGAVRPIITHVRHVDLGPSALPGSMLHCSGQTRYELYAAVMLKGKNPVAGHYIALVRRGEGWFKCDDRVIEQWHSDTCLVEAVQREASGDRAWRPLMLFYRRVQPGALAPQACQVREVQAYSVGPRAAGPRAALDYALTALRGRLWEHQ